MEPNVGRASFRATYPAAIDCSTLADREHTIEIILKDVAGLVPGAYLGRGRGNSFLEDLCDADVLLHVVDGSGELDQEGNQTGGGDPTNDVEWVYAELHHWIRSVCVCVCVCVRVCVWGGWERERERACVCV